MKKQTPKIERGVPLPKRGRRGKFVFLLEMKAGDSVLLDDRACAANAGHRYFGPGNYVTATEGNNARLWRK